MIPPLFPSSVLHTFLIHLWPFTSYQVFFFAKYKPEMVFGGRRPSHPEISSSFSLVTPFFYRFSVDTFRLISFRWRVIQHFSFGWRITIADWRVVLRSLNQLIQYCNPIQWRHSAPPFASLIFSRNSQWTQQWNESVGHGRLLTMRCASLCYLLPLKHTNIKICRNP